MKTECDEPKWQKAKENYEEDKKYYLFVEMFYYTVIYGCPFKKVEFGKISNHPIARICSVLDAFLSAHGRLMFLVLSTGWVRV